ncbi:hypothetical protein C8R45DRAFT_929588 [Mycena sanguinolenta]|nr:hypothetical protein C8R45DRAFT_929588 [Mycena sanguinolenta]
MDSWGEENNDIAWQSQWITDHGYDRPEQTRDHGGVRRARRVPRATQHGRRRDIEATEYRIATLAADYRIGGATAQILNTVGDVTGIEMSGAGQECPQSAVGPVRAGRSDSSPAVLWIGYYVARWWQRRDFETPERIGGSTRRDACCRICVPAAGSHRMEAAWRGLFRAVPFSNSQADGVIVALGADRGTRVREEEIRRESKAGDALGEKDYEATNYSGGIKCANRDPRNYSRRQNHLVELLLVDCGVDPHIIGSERRQLRNESSKRGDLWPVWPDDGDSQRGHYDGWARAVSRCNFKDEPLNLTLPLGPPRKRGEFQLNGLDVQPPHQRGKCSRVPTKISMHKSHSDASSNLQRTRLNIGVRDSVATKICHESDIVNVLGNCSQREQVSVREMLQKRQKEFIR